MSSDDISSGEVVSGPPPSEGASASAGRDDPEILGERPPDYAGDVDVCETWRVLKERDDAVLVDVRTRAEWTFVGIPDLAGAGKEPLLIEWQRFPTMDVNPAFAEDVAAEIRERGLAKDAPVFFLCRSGARSKAAAVALTGEGFTRCHNVAGGFEGDLNDERHRGVRNGWKASGLPWRQS